MDRLDHRVTPQSYTTELHADFVHASTSNHPDLTSADEYVLASIWRKPLSPSRALFFDSLIWSAVLPPVSGLGLVIDDGHYVEQRNTGIKRCSVDAWGGNLLGEEQHTQAPYVKPPSQKNNIPKGGLDQRVGLKTRSAVRLSAEQQNLTGPPLFLLNLHTRGARSAVRPAGSMFMAGSVDGQERLDTITNRVDERLVVIHCRQRMRV